MAHSGGGGEDPTLGEMEPSSPVEIMQQPRVTFDLATVTRRCSPEQQDSHMDEELQALGLWEEDMTEEQKVELLRVVAASKETAQREEAVRKSQFVPAQPPVLAVPIEGREHEYWDRRTIGRGSSHITSPECSDDEWPRPSSAKQCRQFRRQPVAVKVPTRRVYCMDQHLNFEWGQGDEAELQDIRLSRLSRDTEPLPGPSLMSNVGAGDMPSPAKNDSTADHTLASGPKGDWMSPPALLKSWSAMHISLKKAQSAPGLPVRPWGRVREASPLLGSQNSRAPTSVYNAPDPVVRKSSSGSQCAGEEAPWLVNCGMDEPYRPPPGQGSSFSPFSLPRPEHIYQSLDRIHEPYRPPPGQGSSLSPFFQPCLHHTSQSLDYILGPYRPPLGQGSRFSPFSLPRPEHICQSLDCMHFRRRIPMQGPHVTRRMRARLMQRREERGAELRSASAMELCSSSASASAMDASDP